MSNSRALVIKSIKQGETSSIVSCYLEDIGFKSFLVKGLYSKKKSKFSKAHFFPLNVISLNSNISTLTALSNDHGYENVFVNVINVVVS